MVLALAGSATLWMAIVTDMGASLLVIVNALRLLRSSAEASAISLSALRTYILLLDQVTMHRVLCFS